MNQRTYPKTELESIVDFIIKRRKATQEKQGRLLEPFLPYDCEDNPKTRMFKEAINNIIDFEVNDESWRRD